MYLLQLSMCVHPLSRSRAPQPESLSSPQQDVQIVVIVVMQARRGACKLACIEMSMPFVIKCQDKLAPNIYKTTLFLILKGQVCIRDTKLSPSEEAPIHKFTDCSTRSPMIVGRLFEMWEDPDSGGANVLGNPFAAVSAYSTIAVSLAQPWNLLSTYTVCSKGIVFWAL